MASQDKYNDDSVPEPEAVDTDNMEDLFPKVENPPTKTLFQKDHLSEDKIKILSVNANEEEGRHILESKKGDCSNSSIAKLLVDSPDKTTFVQEPDTNRKLKDDDGQKNEDQNNDKENKDRERVTAVAVVSTGAFHTSSDVSYQILRGRKYMSRINDPMRINWDLFVMGCATWNCISVPLAIALIPDAFDIIWLVVMDFLIDFLFLIDIIINFRTTYINAKGEEIADPKQIAKHYLKWRFWIDFLSCFPFDYAARIFTNSNTKYFDLLGLLKLVRIARLTKIINFLNVTENIKMTLKLMKLIFFLILYLHTLACSWYFLVSQTKDYVPPQDYMYVKTDLFEQTFPYKYFVSAYMALAMLNGGECGPRDTEQLLFACTFILIGAIITANIFGTMAVIVEALNRKEAKFQQKLDLANTSMKNMGLPQTVQRKVINYIFYTQSSLEQQTELKSFLRLISPSLRMEIIRHMFGGVLRMNSVFMEQSNGVIDFIIGNLDTLVYFPDDQIVFQGETADQMYFINKGDCEVSILDYTGKFKLIGVLRKGAYFGELALLNGGKRTASVKALNYSSVAALSADRFKEMKKEFPSIIEMFKGYAMEYKDSVRVFIKSSMSYLDLFESCDEKTLHDIFITMKAEEYNEGTIIQKRHKIPSEVIFIANGQIELRIEMDEGKEELLDVLGPGSILNMYGALKQTPTKFKAICSAFTSVYLFPSSKIKKMIKKYDSLKEGHDYLMKKWAIHAPMCDYTTILPKRPVKQVFEDCVARYRVFKKKQEQVGNKFTSLLENVKKQQLEEKRMANLAFLGAPSGTRRTSLISPDIGDIAGGTIGEQIEKYQYTIESKLRNLEGNISDVKNFVFNLQKELKK